MNQPHLTMNLTAKLAFVLPLLACVRIPVISSAQTSTLGQAPQISEYVREVFQDRDGDYWFGTNGDGVCRYADGRFTNYTEANGLSDNSVWSLMLDSAGTLWAGTHKGVCRFDGKAFAPFPLPGAEVENSTSRFTHRVVFLC